MFSGISRRFIVLDKKSLDSVVLILRNPEKYSNSHTKLIKNLRDNGFLLDDELEETDILKTRRERFVTAKEYKTTLVSTYKCNYNCWYCVQKHFTEDIDPEKLKLIVRHVKDYLVENSIQSYILSWFGGEPLMESEVIDTVSAELLRFCHDKGVQFIGAITTNGSLLTQEIIGMLCRNRIDHYQITIDGDKPTHDRTKNMPGEDSSFETILNNIVALLRHNRRAELTLRFNYTGKSLKSGNLVDDVDKIIPKELRGRINVDSHKVWQVNEISIPLSDLGAMLMRFHNSGYGISSEHVFSMCYVDKLHHNTIFYNGIVDKCDHRADKGLRGFLDTDGHIVWKERPVLYDVNPLEEGKRCHDCGYYPICNGCCPIHREEEIIEKGEMTCDYEGAYEIFEHRILDYCIREMIKLDIPL